MPCARSRRWEASPYFHFNELVLISWKESQGHSFLPADWPSVTDVTAASSMPASLLGQARSWPTAEPQPGTQLSRLLPAMQSECADSPAQTARKAQAALPRSSQISHGIRALQTHCLAHKSVSVLSTLITDSNNVTSAHSAVQAEAMMINALVMGTEQKKY